MATQNNILRHQAFMSVAKALAKLSNGNDLKVGAIFVVGGHIMMTGWNDESTNPVTHAETACLNSKFSSVHPYEDGDFYVTTAPCLNCAKRIIEHGAIRCVYYQHPWWDVAALKLLGDNGIKTERIRREMR